MTRKFPRMIGGFGMVAATCGMATAGAAAPAASAGPIPFARYINHAFAGAPTTAQCEQAIGLACYSPNQYEAAYDMLPLYQNGDTGKGKSIVIVDSYGTPTIQSDLATFDKTFKLPAPPHFTIIQPAGQVPPWDPNNSVMSGWGVETSLDVEYSHAMAPGANILLVETPVAETEGVTGFPQIVEAENYVINHHLGDVISQSFGATEETFPSEQSLLNLRSAYENAQSHNVTVLAATGDAGATDSKANGVDYYTHRVSDWPATDPLVTAVGGTQLHLNNAGDRLLPDNVWNDTNELGSPAAGSGGTSEYFARPAFQNSVASVVGNARGVPDVSMSAAVDGAALVYWSFPGGGTPGFYLVGGTSEATPLFAGLVAVADQAAGHDIGYLNPMLYNLQAGNAAGLVDITTGNNTVTFEQNGTTYTVKGFDAVPGYDLASGLGTADGAKLVPELTGSTSSS